MIQVKNTKTGEIQTLESDKALPDLVQSGAVAIPNKDYEFESPEGDKYKVRAQGFLDAVKSGWKFRDQEVIRQEELEKKYGDSTAKALLYGGLRGASLGLSDAILASTGIVDKEELDAVKEFNPVASNVAEIGTNIAPILLSGGSGLVGKAVVKELMETGVSRELAEQMVKEKGTTLFNKIMAASPASLAEGAAALTGKRAAQNVKSEVAKRAIELGAAGAIEGTAIGLSQSITEAAVGDHEFNAESLLSNIGTGALIGGGLGSVVGAGIEYAKKASKISQRKVVDTIVSQIDGDESFKKEVSEKLQGDNAIEEGLLALKDPEIQKIKEAYPDSESVITKGMDSAYRPVKQAEDYLFDAPSVAGEEIRKKASDLKEYVEKNVNEIWHGARDATPEETGDLIKKTFFQNINEPRESGRVFYEGLMDEFGGATVPNRFRTELANTIEASDAFRIGGEGSEIKRVLNIVKDKDALISQHTDELLSLGLNKRQITEIRKDGGISAKLNRELNNSGINLKQFNDTLARHASELPKKELTLSQVKQLQKDVASKAKLASGAERELLNDVAGKLRSMQDSIIRSTVGDSKAAKKIIAGLEAANSDYRRMHAEIKEIGELFGIKAKDADTLLEKIGGMSSLELEKKFLNIKYTDKAFKILEKHPEVGKLVLRNRQRQLLTKHSFQDGTINYGALKKALRNMPEQERALYFGGNKGQEKKLMDMLTLGEKRPKTLNPSGTDIRNEVRNLLNPKQMVQNWALSEIYRGNDSSLGKLVGRVLPTLGAIEKSSNRQKNKIASSVTGFFKAVGAGVTIGTLEMMSDKDLEKARKSYELVQSNPEALIQKYLDNNKVLSEVAPQTANALQQRIIAGVQFLQSKTPHRDQSYIGEKLEPSRTEIMKFNDYVEAVERPQVIYEQLKDGYINPNTLETLRVVYPKTYASIQAEVLAKMPKSLTRAQKIQLQPLLGARVTPAMDYKNLMVLQNKTASSAAANVQANNQLTHVPSGAASKINASGRAETGLAKTLNRT